MRRPLLYFSLLFVVPLFIFPTERVGTDENGDGRNDTWEVFEDGRRKAVYYDSNYDGEIDYAHIFNKDGDMIEERMDYNHDGGMDDFYFYDDGVLERREVDTNYNGNIDVWVYLEEGVYIFRYERDTNHDGEIDLIKDYRPE